MQEDHQLSEDLQSAGFSLLSGHSQEYSNSNVNSKYTFNEKYSAILISCLKDDLKAYSTLCISLKSEVNHLKSENSSLHFKIENLEEELVNAQEQRNELLSFTQNFNQDFYTSPISSPKSVHSPVRSSSHSRASSIGMRDKTEQKLDKYKSESLSLKQKLEDVELASEEYLTLLKVIAK